MAKSLRSNNKKALRTVRRQKLAADPKWQSKAEEDRLAVMARVLNAPKASEVGEGVAGMDLDVSPAQTRSASAVAAQAPVDEAQKMVISTGKIQLTKKKAMKLKRQKKLKSEASWKSGTVSAFHDNKRKLKRRRY